MTVPLHQRNYRLGIVNGIVVEVGNRLADPMTVLPLLLIRLSGLTWMVGLLQAIVIVAPAIPAIAASRWVDAADRKLPIFRLYSTFRFLALIGMAVVVLLGRHISGISVAVLLLVFFAAWLIAQGVSTLAFLDLVAKSAPTTRRGSFWMWRQVVGLLLVVTVVVPFIHFMLSDAAPVEFPINYGVLLLAAALVLGVAWLVYAQVHEPPSKPARRILSMRQHVARGARIWDHDARLRRMVRVVLLLSSAGAIGPFFSTLGAKEWGFPDTAAATFMTVQMISQMIGSVIQGRVSDRHGNRLVLILASVTSLLNAGVATFAAWSAPTGGLLVCGYEVTYRMLLLCACFAGSGVFIALLGPGRMNYLMDIAPERKRPSYIGFTSVYLLPCGVVPIILGILAQGVGFWLVFAISTLLSVVAIVLSLKVKEPRDDLDEGKLDEVR